MVACQRQEKQRVLCSPDGRTQVVFSLSEAGEPLYSVLKDDSVVLHPSRMGLVTTGPDYREGFVCLGIDTSSFSETWETVWGEEQYIDNTYRQMTIHLGRQGSREPAMDIVFRCYDDGFAFRYVLQGTDSITVTDEVTEFAFAHEPQAWSIPWRTEYYEALWTREPLLSKDTMCSPITLEMADGTYAFLHEAALTDYPVENFYITADRTVGTFLTPWCSEGRELRDKAYIRLPFATPWRMMVLADGLPQLVASRLMLNLNDPCRIEDTSWIQPQKFIGIWWGMHMKRFTWEQGPKHGATTARMKEYIDFAADHHFGGVLAEGWNTGWETWKNFSFVTPYPDYDIEEVTRYAMERGVNVIGHNETGGNARDYERDLDTIYAYHQAHHIHTIKTGYVSPIITTRDGQQYNRSQSGVRHYRRVIETAAKYQIMIDNHEPVMPTGLQRTYPNLMTQEGIRGQEWNAWAQDGGSPASHVATLPYTRMLAGPADYTPGVVDFANPVQPGTRVHSTLVNQLALFVVLYSPLQMACDLPEHYAKCPLLEFIEQVPCDWQRSVLLDGKIGEYVVMARQDRHSQDWYVGAVTNEQERDICLPLSFLGEGEYRLTEYLDDNTDWQTNPYAARVLRPEQPVSSCDTIRLHLSACGGAALQLVR